MSRRGRPYVDFGLFALLSSGRDVASEHLFKGPRQADPVLVLFVYASSALLVASIAALLTESAPLKLARHGKGVYRDAALASAFTGLAFLAMILAIASPLGAALHGIVEYASGPVMTAAAGVLLLRERRDRRLGVSVLLGFVGTALLVSSKLSSPRAVSADLWFGLGCAVFGSFAAAMYRVYYKRLLAAAVPTTTIIFYRMIVLVLATGVILIVRRPPLPPSLLLEVTALGLLGFTLPLFLILRAMRTLELRSLALLMFLPPLATLAISTAAGYARIGWPELAGSVLIVLAVIGHERGARGADADEEATPPTPSSADEQRRDDPG